MTLSTKKLNIYLLYGRKKVRLITVAIEQMRKDKRTRVRNGKVIIMRKKLKTRENYKP
jgi:hypothetical protein